MTWLVCLGMSLTTPGASCAADSGGKKSFSRNIQARLNRVVDAKMAEFKVPGAIVGVWVPGRGEWIACKGSADIRTKAVPTVRHHVRVASITKTFTATVVLQLVDEQKLSLNDTLNKFAPDVAVPNSDRITIRNLLNMTSGLYNFTDDHQNFWEKFLADPAAPWTPKQLVDISRAHGALCAPGQKGAYNNTNYVLLGMIIEKVTGNTAGEEITRRIIDRLGLKKTIFPVTTAMPVPFMHGYLPDLNMPDKIAGPAITDISVETPTAFYTAGGIISDLMDLKTWLAVLAEGKLLSPEMHREQLTFAAPNTSYGLGVMNGGAFIGHSGEITGYNSSAYTQIGGGGATVIVLLNRYPSKMEGVSDQITTAILKTIAHLIRR